MKSPNLKIDLSAAQLDFILSPKGIRERAALIYDRTISGKTNFIYKEEKFTSTVDFVIETIYKNYPDLNIPFHSRWGHLRAGKIDRVKNLFLNESAADSKSKIAQARTMLDLVITSVLLDAGAGPQWKYVEENNKKEFSRSEGLGVASFYLFQSKGMSSTESLNADAQGLKSVTSKTIEKFFQVSTENPLIGVEGRTLLLNNLGRAIENKSVFVDQRPGNILDNLMARFGSNIPAAEILRFVLENFGPIWPGRIFAGNINLGDVWHYDSLGELNFQSLVPIHKLSQWMTYSLIEPFLHAGINVTGVENLTGLAEYRNGGLLVDTGLIEPKDSRALQQQWSVNSNFIIEWRALTLYLLDKIGDEVQKKLKKSPSEFPLAKVLEGGTWWAGRFLAQAKRKNGEPPIKILSDGTVF